jgi:hypothetical protein
MPETGRESAQPVEVTRPSTCRVSASFVGLDRDVSQNPRKSGSGRPEHIGDSLYPSGLHPGNAGRKMAKTCRARIASRAVSRSGPSLIFRRPASSSITLCKYPKGADKTPACVWHHGAGAHPTTEASPVATAHMPADTLDLLARRLPPEQTVGPRGGRPRIGHRVVVRVIWFVLATADPWEDMPAELGCSGRTPTAGSGPGMRPASGTGWTACTSGRSAAGSGGEATGPSPVDRRESGTRHTLNEQPAGRPASDPDVRGECQRP